MIHLKTTIAAVALLASSSLASAEEITLWVRTSSGAVLQGLAEKYNASHSDKVNVTQITAEQMVPKLGAAIAGGAAPDGAVLDLIYLPTFAANDSLEDISDFVKGLPYSAALSPWHIRLATYDGKVYGVPALPDASIIAYNTDLFKKAGLDPDKAPASLEEIAADAKKIHALDKETYGFYFVANSGSWLIYDFLPHLWAANADVLSDDGRTATVDTPAMAQIELDSKFTDKLETVLYNGALSGISRDGEHYFYENVLESHGQNRRWKWHYCPCCPTNIARFITSLGQYFYSTKADEVAIHLYGENAAELSVGNVFLRLTQKTQYPWNGDVKVSLGLDQPKRFTLRLRIPGWCRDAKAFVNGEGTKLDVVKGYAAIDREWKDGDEVRLAFDMGRMANRSCRRVTSFSSIRVAGSMAIIPI